MEVVVTKNVSTCHIPVLEIFRYFFKEKKYDLLYEVYWQAVVDHSVPTWKQRRKKGKGKEVKGITTRL